VASAARGPAVREQWAGGVGPPLCSGPTYPPQVHDDRLIADAGVGDDWGGAH